jgi:ParB-like chromosome segregation protein Spo0J
MDWTEVLSAHPQVKGIHPAADLFPLLQDAELAELCESIRKDGLDQPVMIDEAGSLLDGRNRLIACHKTGTTLAVEVYQGPDPVGFSLRANLHRRHLNQGQKAMVALKVEEIFAEEAKERSRQAAVASNKARAERKVPDMANLPDPDIFKQSPPPVSVSRLAQPPARDQAAAVLGTSGRSVQMAKVVSKAAPDLAAKVERGQMPLHRAYRETQDRQLSQPPPEELKWPEDQLKRRRVVEAGGAVVANMHSGSDEFLLRWARSTNRFIRIDRSSQFGNPYEMPGDGDRDKVCESFSLYFQRKFSLHSQVKDLAGKVLGCWCYPQRCHGNHFISLLSQEGDNADF